MSLFGRSVALTFAAATILAFLAGDRVLAAECREARGSGEHSVGIPCLGMIHDGRQRSYLIHVPQRLADPAPVLFAIHGGGGAARGMAGLVKGRLNDLAEEDNFLLVYPEGIGGGWNDGRDNPVSKAIEEKIDDVGFMVALIDNLSVSYPIDRSRVYAAGISNGGMMALRLACDAADRFAAVAAVTANMPADLVENCNPKRPISTMIINGTEDPLMPFDGGEIRVFLRTRGTVISAFDTFGYWANKNGCEMKTASEPLDDFPADGTHAVTHDATGCSGEAAVTLIEIRGGGHTWPGGAQYLPAMLIGPVSRELDASTTIWRYLREHRIQ